MLADKRKIKRNEVAYGFIDQQAKCGRFSLPQPVRNPSILNYSGQKGGKPLPALFGVTDLII